MRCEWCDASSSGLASGHHSYRSSPPPHTSHAFDTALHCTALLVCKGSRASHSKNGFSGLFLQSKDPDASRRCSSCWHHGQHLSPRCAIAPGLSTNTAQLTARRGQNAGLSLTALPAVMQAPAPLAAKQWHSVFTVGGFYARPLAILSALATGYVAYHRKSWLHPPCIQPVH
jgi:hypothetical protein